MISETLLRGIVACAGTASSQSCGSGASGAVASSLLTGLFSQSSPEESEEQREAKRNLIVSLVTGLAATSASIDPTTANTAAGGAVDNNWLATQQIVQFKKEYDEAKGFGETGKVFAKWAYISSKQDVLTQFGIGKGLAQSGWNDVTGLAEFVAHPIEGSKGLKELVNNPAAREQFGETLIKELNVKIDRVTVALEKGGDENAVLLGQSIGEIAWQVGSIATGVGGAATGGVALAKAGIKVGGAQLEKMAELARIEKVAANNAKNLNPMSAMTDSEAAVLVDRNVLEAGTKAIPESSYPSLAKPSPNAPSNVILGELDSLGRPTGVTAVLREDSLGGGSSANPAIRPPGFEGQPANHARGHLLANSLGGAGDDARNLVTLFQRNANHPNMSSFERQVRGAVQSGETVSYRAVPIYTGTNPMPTGVTLSARGSGGFTLDVSIPNVSGVK
ncbi:DNA/RNA non-specific endonuclease [Pseudomonas viridiflava]